MLLPHKQKWCQAGYTLVELMVAVALTGIVTVAIYKGYVSVSTAYDVQDQAIEVQENARVAMNRMAREIRMAGYDPTELGTAGISATSTNHQIKFSRYDDTAGAMTFISYRWDQGGTDDLQRREGAAVDTGTWQSVIENVSELDFSYVGNTGVPAASSDVARGVMIALVVRATNEDYGYTDNRDYIVPQPVGVGDLTLLSNPNDNFRRRLLTAIVGCRNMGM